MCRACRFSEPFLERFSQPVFQGEYPGWSFEPGCLQALPGDFTEGQDPFRKMDYRRPEVLK
jgi:hypothetical protein